MRPSLRHLDRLTVDNGASGVGDRIEEELFILRKGRVEDAISTTLLIASCSYVQISTDFTDAGRYLKVWLVHDKGSHARVHGNIEVRPGM